jgi:hypothetical protein
MSKAFLAALSALAMLAATSGAVLAAEEQPASAAELTLRVGDTITWAPQGPHRLRFGGSVNNGALALTKFSDVQKVLGNFTPPPPDASADGAVSWPAITKVTTKVKADSGTPAVTEFFFTCAAHMDAMVTVPFKVESALPGQPARNIQIVSAHDLPLRWVLQTTPGNTTGDRSLRRP